MKFCRLQFFSMNLDSGDEIQKSAGKLIKDDIFKQDIFLYIFVQKALICIQNDKGNKQIINSE